MSKSYYGSSFLIASVVYTALGVTLYTLVQTPVKTLTKPIPKPIKIAVITPIVKPTAPAPIIVPIPPVVTPPKKVVEPKPKPKPKPKKSIQKVKPKPKKITKKSKPKPTPKPKKVVQPTKTKVKEHFTPAPVVTQSPLQAHAPVTTPIAPVMVPKAPQVDNSAQKRAFLHHLRSKIIANKKYSKIALRRHIEGAVKVKFDITSTGAVSNIRFVSGKSILQKSVKDAIAKSFPLNIPTNLKNQFPMYNIAVTVNFKIN